MGKQRHNGKDYCMQTQGTWTKFLFSIIFATKDYGYADIWIDLFFFLYNLLCFHSHLPLYHPPNPHTYTAPLTSLWYYYTWLLFRGCVAPNQVAGVVRGTWYIIQKGWWKHLTNLLVNVQKPGILTGFLLWTSDPWVTTDTFPLYLSLSLIGSTGCFCQRKWKQLSCPFYTLKVPIISRTR